MAGSSERPTRPITSSDTVALINSVVVPAIEEIKGDMKVINNRLTNIECDTKNVDETIKQLRVTLYGNGDADKGGLITIVAGLKKWVDDRSTYEKIIAAAIVGELIGLISLLLVH